MNDEARTATPTQYDVVDFELLIDGKNVAREFQVLSLTTGAEANSIASAKIVLRDGEASGEIFRASEGTVFVPGKKVEIKLGDPQQKKSVFKGIIVKQCLRARGNGTLLTVECRHAAFKMTLGRHNKYFEKMKDSEIFDDLLGQYGLGGSVDATSVQHKEIVQFNATDWDFLLLRAEANGRLVFPEGDKIEVKKPSTSGAAVKTLLFGENLIDFDAELDARYQWKSVESKSWDFAKQAFLENETSTAPAFSEAGNLSGAKLAEVGAPAKFELRHSGHLPEPELKAWAEAAMLKSRLAKICGRGKIKGEAEIKPGVMVELKGCGARFNGKVYVTGVRHEVVSGTWFSHVQFGLAPEWFAQKPDIQDVPAGGLVSAVRGLQIGVVVALENDPDGEDRIQVKIPVVDNAAKGTWARVSTLDAGKERGTFFRPEIGDEVVVGFLNDDPRDAIVLGMLNSSAKPAPVPGAKDTNHIKGLQTRSKMKVFFDDEKKAITIETPAGNKILVSEDQKTITLEDQNGNNLIMDDKGISMKSVKDLKIEAAQSLSLKAGTEFKAESGTAFSAKAGTQLKVEGSAGAELSTSAIATIKGSLVKIN